MRNENLRKPIPYLSYGFSQSHDRLSALILHNLFSPNKILKDEKNEDKLPKELKSLSPLEYKSMQALVKKWLTVTPPNESYIKIGLKFGFLDRENRLKNEIYELLRARAVFAL